MSLSQPLQWQSATLIEALSDFDDDEAQTQYRHTSVFPLPDEISDLIATLRSSPLGQSLAAGRIRTYDLDILMFLEYYTDYQEKIGVINDDLEGATISIAMDSMGRSYATAEWLLQVFAFLYADNIPINLRSTSYAR